MGPYEARRCTVITASNSIEWQRIWFAVRQHPWTSLALVSTHDAIDILGVAEALAVTGRQVGERPVTVKDATGLEMAGVQTVIESLNSSKDRSEWALVPVDPITRNASAIAVVRATSAAVLVIRVGESLMSDAHSTLEDIGRERFVGSIIVDGDLNPVSA
jgi:hypothetical protein